MKINRVWSSFTESCSVLEIVVDNYKVTFSMESSVVDSSGQRQLFEFKPLPGYRPYNVMGMPFKELVVGQGTCRLVVDLNDEAEYSLSNVVYIDLNGEFRWAVVGSLGSCEARVDVKKELLKGNDNMNEQKLNSDEEMKLKAQFDQMMEEMVKRETPLIIKIKYHEDKYGEMTKLERIDKGDWIDLRAAETVEMKQGEFRLISLGISMQFPPGYEAHMATRSSTYKTWGILLANSHSIIDESYNGDNDIWLFPALAMRDTVIKKGDRIAQFRLVEKMPTVEFEEVETLGNPDRGGLGSTGKQ